MDSNPVGLVSLQEEVTMQRERDQTRECRDGRPHEEEGDNFHSQAKVVPFTILISDFQLPKNIAVV